jgi:hypothetical protein
MIDERLDSLLSQLADGELSSDQANGLLLQVLGDPEARCRLKEHLHLRQALRPRRQRNEADRGTRAH